MQRQRIGERKTKNRREKDSGTQGGDHEEGSDTLREKRTERDIGKKAWKAINTLIMGKCSLDTGSRRVTERGLLNKERERQRQRGTKRDTETDRQRDKEKQRQRDAKKNRARETEAERRNQRYKDRETE